MVAASMGQARARQGYFYVWMAAACALIAFGGFAPTYWLQMPAGTFVGPPILHLHGLIFSAWPILLLSQTWMAASGRMEHHRAWGLFGVALASAMVFAGMAAAINSLGNGLAAGLGDPVRSFFIVPVSALVLFAGFFVAAILNLRRPDAHKRLMLLASIVILEAAVARVFFILATGGGPGARPGLGPPPPMGTSAVPALLLESLVIAGILYDWRTRGRPHPAWLIGGALIAANAVLRIPISGTPAWLHFADAMAHFVG